MSFQQSKLPYAPNSLSPFVSEEQMNFHYGKHHAAYFSKLNSLVNDRPESEWDLREVIIKSSGPIFNNAAQAWNHTFFWECMNPSGGGKPQGELLAAIERDFASYEAFRKMFSDSAAGLFGSGWAWLACDNSGKLEIMALSNADMPLRHNKQPILTLDVWEHAYYIDYRNSRPNYLKGFWEIVDWDAVAKRFA